MPLAPAEVATAFLHGRIPRTGQGLDELPQPNYLRRIADCRRPLWRVKHLRSTERNVFPDRSRKQEWFLQHKTHLAAQTALRHITHIMAIDQHPTALDIVEPHQEADDGALARPRTANKCNPVSRICLE